MRILDNDGDLALSDVTILLTRREAESLKDAVNQMLSEIEQGHYHIIDLDNCRPEFVIGIYNEENAEENTYSPRLMRLIKNGE